MEENQKFSEKFSQRIRGGSFYKRTGRWLKEKGADKLGDRLLEKDRKDTSTLLETAVTNMKEMKTKVDNYLNEDLLPHKKKVYQQMKEVSKEHG